MGACKHCTVLSGGLAACLGAILSLALALAGGCAEQPGEVPSVEVPDEPLREPGPEADEQPTAVAETQQEPKRIADRPAPDAPVAPKAPVTPKAPSTSEAPVTPKAPATSEVPVTPKAPAPSQVLVTPKAPAPSEAPGTPRAPATSEAPVTPNAPAASEAPVPSEAQEASPSTASKADTFKGLIADDPTAASANTKALRLLVSPPPHCGPPPCGVAKPVAPVVFPKARTYYFDDGIPLRHDTLIHLNLGGSTFHFRKAYEAANDQGTGFFHTLGRLLLENGTIVVDYKIPTDLDRPPVHSGAALMLGSRASLGSRTYFKDVWDGDLERPMGDITLRNLTISTNNHGPSSRAIAMFGGLQNVHAQNVSIDGQGGLRMGVAYEFGMGERPVPKSDKAPDGLPSRSSHAHNMTFKNIRVKNLSDERYGQDEAIGSQAMRFGGAYDVLVDGLEVDGAWNGFAGDGGEAAYYFPWGNVPAGPDRVITVRNVRMRNVVAGLILGGGGRIDHGYLGSKGYVKKPPPEVQTDLLFYRVDGFDISSASQPENAGVTCTGGGVDARNGAVTGFSAGFKISADCTQVKIDNVKVCRSGLMGIQLGWDNFKLFKTPRGSTGYIRNSSISGSGTEKPNHGIVIDHSKDFVIENNVFDSKVDCPQPEPTQHAAVAAWPNNRNLVVRNNCVLATVGNRAPYWAGVPNTPSGQLTLINNRGMRAAVGPWSKDDGPDVACQP